MTDFKKLNRAEVGHLWMKPLEADKHLMACYAEIDRLTDFYNQQSKCDHLISALLCDLGNLQDDELCEDLLADFRRRSLEILEAEPEHRKYQI